VDAGKTNWADFDPAEGKEVQRVGSNGKVGGKWSYEVRAVARYIKDGDTIKGYVPAPLKATKITVAAMGKAPSLKPNYKTETILPKAGQALSLNEGATYTVYGKAAAEAAGNRAAVVAVDKANAPKLPAGGVVKVFTVATAKKPASATLIIEVADRAAQPTATAGLSAAVKSGKINVPKTIEVKGDTKYGNKVTSTPAAGATEFFTIRVKSTAKADKAKVSTVAATIGDATVKVAEGKMASLDTPYQVTWAESKDAKGKSQWKGTFAPVATSTPDPDTTTP